MRRVPRRGRPECHSRCRRQLVDRERYPAVAIFDTDLVILNYTEACSWSVKDFNDIKIGDQLEVYEVVEVARSL